MCTTTQAFISRCQSISSVGPAPLALAALAVALLALAFAWWFSCLGRRAAHGAVPWLQAACALMAHCAVKRALLIVAIATGALSPLEGGAQLGTPAVVSEKPVLADHVDPVAGLLLLGGMVQWVHWWRWRRCNVMTLLGRSAGSRRGVALYSYVSPRDLCDYEQSPVLQFSAPEPPVLGGFVENPVPRLDRVVGVRAPRGRGLGQCLNACTLRPCQKL